MRKLLFSVLVIMSVFTCNTASAFAVTHYFSAIRNSTGDAVSGATVTVYGAGTLVLSSIYSDQAGTIVKSNPFLSDSNGNYDFYVASGLYKVTVSKVGVGTFTTDNILIGILAHANTHKDGGSDELLLSDFDGTITSTQILNGTVLNVDINASAAIDESKLALSFPTHSNTNDPTTDQKAALGGTSGLPSVTNKYVTNNDARNSNTRTPTAHAASHTDGGLDEVTITTGQLSGVNGGTNLTADLEEETHATEHQDGGADEISVAGLSGALADAQKSEVLLNGASVGTRPKINLIEGTDIDLTVADNSGANRVDVTVNSTASVAGGGSNLNVYEGLTLKKSDVTDIHFYGMDIGGGGPAGYASVNPSAWVGGNVVGTPTNNHIAFFGESPAMNPVGFDTAIHESDFSLAFNYIGPGAFQGEWYPKLSIFPCYQGPGAFVTGGDGGDGGDSVNLPPYDPWIFGCDNTSELNAPFEGQILVFDGVDRTDVNHAWHNKWSPTICRNNANCEAGKWISFSNIFTLEDTVSGSGEPVQIGIDEETLRDAQKIRGKNVDTGAVSDGQTFVYDAGSSTWVFGSATASTKINTELPSPDTFTNVNEMIFVSPFGVVSGGGGNVSVSLTTLDGSYLATDSVNDTHIDWGSGAGQVNTDDVPESATKKYVPAAQLTELTSSGNTGLHYHASDRALANATGTLPANQVGTGLTNAQVLNDLTISSSGNINAAALTSGTVPTLRIGNQKYQTKSIMIPYPDSFLNVAFGNIYMPYASTITQIAGKIRESIAGGNCTFHVKIDSTAALASPLAADDNGEITGSITNPTIGAGTWMNFIITGCTAADDASELSITVVYLVN